MNPRFTGVQVRVDPDPPDTPYADGARYVMVVRGPLIPWGDFIEMLPPEALRDTFEGEATPAWPPDDPGFCYEFRVRTVMVVYHPW